MRAIILQMLFLICIPTIVIYPHIGVLMYYWFTWLNPHRLVWGMLQLDWGKIIAVSTLLFWIISKESKRIPLDKINVFVIILLIWTTISTILSKYPGVAWGEYINWLKVVVMMLVATALINDKIRLHAFIWMICISIGFFGVKGGLFTIVSGGNAHVLGPPKSAIFDTNEISRAFLMTIPLMYYLFLHSYYKSVRIIMLCATMLTVAGLLGTTSRTAFAVFVVMLFFWWLRSSSKIKIGLAGMLALGVIFVALPKERIEGLSSKHKTSVDYDTDNSFQDRIEIWNYVMDNLAANNPISGGGFNAIIIETTRAPHSSYFQVLGEHGYVGLAIFLLLGLISLLQSNFIYKRLKGYPDLAWARDLMFCLQLSFIGHFLGGVTKNHAFFEFYYMQLAIVVAVGQIVSAELREKAKVSAS